MSGYEQQLFIVTAGFFICLGIMILSFALAAVFFFRFQVPVTIARMIGRNRNRAGADRKKKHIREPSDQKMLLFYKERDTVVLPAEEVQRQEPGKESTDGKTDDLRKNFRIIEQIAVVHSDEFI